MGSVHFKRFKGRTPWPRALPLPVAPCTNAPAVKRHPVTAPRDAMLSPCFWRVGMSMAWEPECILHTDRRPLAPLQLALSFKGALIGANIAVSK